MPRVWFSFWDGLFGSSFSLHLFCWPFVVSIVYVLYTLSFLVNIMFFIDKKNTLYRPLASHSIRPIYFYGVLGVSSLL